LPENTLADGCLGGTHGGPSAIRNGTHCCLDGGDTGP